MTIEERTDATALEYIQGTSVRIETDSPNFRALVAAIRFALSEVAREQREACQKAVEDAEAFGKLEQRFKRIALKAIEEHVEDLMFKLPRSNDTAKRLSIRYALQKVAREQREACAAALLEVQNPQGADRAYQAILNANIK